MRNLNPIVLAAICNLLIVTIFTLEQLRIGQQLALYISESEVLEASNLLLRNQLQTLSNNNELVIEELKRNFIRTKELTEHTKSCQIRIKGVPEEDGEDLKEKVTDIVKMMDVTMSAADVVRVNRVGTSKKKSTPRVIVVELTNLKLKALILRKASTALLDTPYAIQDDVTNHVMPPAFAEVENLMNFDEGCGYIYSVSEPETRAQGKKMFGAWLQDPVKSPEGITDNHVWLLPHFYENKIVEEYGSIFELSRKKVRNKYTLPYEWAGTGHVVYNGTLYFVPYESSNIVRYDFTTASILAERQIPGAISGNNAPYQWSGSTDIDLSTDISGLWAIYATYENTMDIAISKIDPVTLQVLQTWNTNWRKQWSGNAFMMCGVLYVLKKYDEHNTALSYIYDTRIKRYKRVNIPFTNKYEWNTMLEFNSRKQQIYAWDRGYLVTYNVTLSRNLPD